uniref:[histone H3]-trimethyl-L-lysine(4) demethylase n=1 Tax=Neogobius melanostomus TaxID=47308 RepID=A0A8C6UUZ9_9GOBI
MTQPPCEFIPPPECPVFEPSLEEFSDPFAYINKIRPIAEKTGICKIRPPQEWQPPFACDVDRLKFTPRIQRLNELEAQTRVKLNFLDQIAKFWELQGSTLKIPHVERKILDLYQLNKLVNDEGGFEIVCRDRHWSKISVKMGFSPGKAIGSHLRAHYERILYPYNMFQTGTNLSVRLTRPAYFLTNDTKDQEYTPHDIPQRQSVQPQETCAIARRAKRMRAEVGFCMSFTSKLWLCRKLCLVLFFFFFICQKIKIEPGEVCDTRPALRMRRMGTFLVSALQVDHYMCLVCGQGNAEDRLLLCDGCDDSYHTFCLLPPLQDVPKGDWRCPKCLAQECGKPQAAFGFEQASRSYTLQAFGDMADSFKSDYFNMPVHMVPTELVEKEFWRLVSTIEEDVTVEYGADIASKEFGSGFPVKNGHFQVSPEDEQYLSSGWNLNNMPVLDASVLTHITADICGMKLPWLYVGMCFSSFCWHIEDHWSYSINYLHWGEPKTWYGVPCYAAEHLESVMRKLAPELFECQPDLLHQLVTIMNPNTLMNHGVPVFRTNQCAGEFVITFPRAYHSGFNQGFNFAEAVNFCTMDWMPIGRSCIEHYRDLRRYCVFSHDEMVCNMALKAPTLDVNLAAVLTKEVQDMLQEEEELRKKVTKLGVVRSQQVDFELLPDEERQCDRCLTTCFLSGLACDCRPKKMVCLYHFHELCQCPTDKLSLHYKFTLEELYPIVASVKHRAESYENWLRDVTEILEKKEGNKRSEMETKTHGFDWGLCTDVTRNQTNLRPLRSGGAAQSGGAGGDRRFPRRQPPGDLLTRVEDFEERSARLLSDESPSPSDLQDLLDLSLGLDVELPQRPVLRERLEQARWLEAVAQHSSQPEALCLDTMRRLIDQGVGLAPHGSVEKAMARLQELLTVSEQWEERALGIEALDEALQEVDNIPAFLPNCLELKDTVERARSWVQEAEALQLGGRIPVLETLSELLQRADSIPVKLEPLGRLEALVSDVQAWKESAAKTFLLRNSRFSLLEVLCPRCDVGPGLLRSKSKKGKEMSQTSRRSPSRLDSVCDVEKALSEIHCKEMELLLALRTSNESRFSTADDGNALSVCVCQKPPSGEMVRCELCRDLFHGDCVQLERSELEYGEAWFCPFCQRSRKPPLDKVLPLLASLQRIRVRLPEGDALRFLIERTVKWQHKVQQACSDGLLDLHFGSEYRMVVPVHRRKTVRANGPKSARKALILSSAIKRRNPVKRSRRRAERGGRRRGARGGRRGGGAAVLPSTPQTRPAQSQTRTTVCVRRRGAGNQRETRYGLPCILGKCFFFYWFTIMEYTQSLLQKCIIMESVYDTTSQSSVKLPFKLTAIQQNISPSKYQIHSYLTCKCVGNQLVSMAMLLLSFGYRS